MTTPERKTAAHYVGYGIGLVTAGAVFLFVLGFLVRAIAWAWS